MLRDFNTLVKLKDEFQQLVGTNIIEIFSQEKDTAIFIFHDGINKYILHFSAICFYSACYLDNEFVRAKNNSADIFNSLLGDVLQEVNILNEDRILEFKFIKHDVYFFLFGGANSNLFVCDKKKNILDILNNSSKSSKYINTKLEFSNKFSISNKNINNINNNLQDLNNKLILDDLISIDKLNIYNVLKIFNPRTNKNYLDEFLFEENISQDIFFSVSELQQLINKFNNFNENILSSKKYYLLENNSQTENKPHEVLFSLIPLKKFNIILEFDDISKAIKKTQIARLISNQKNIICKELLPKLKRDEKKILENIRISENLDEALERADNYRSYAELLLAQPNLKSKNGNSIELASWDDKLISIKLDEKLNLLDNAQKYYTKSKKTLIDLEIKQARLPKLKNKLAQIQLYISKINSASTLKELNNIRSEVIKTNLILMQNEERSLESKFRKFNLGEGYILYVGKNATDNDTLTMKFAKPNDYWLHARGSSGSHCVIKLESNSNISGKVPKNILKAAAEIAAYYSGSKNAKYTPVCYTQKKYVRKPKGANVGAVVLQREEVIMVEPKLPPILD